MPWLAICRILRKIGLLERMPGRGYITRSEAIDYWNRHKKDAEYRYSVRREKALRDAYCHPNRWDDRVIRNLNNQLDEFRYDYMRDIAYCEREIIKVRDGVDDADAFWKATRPGLERLRLYAELGIRAYNQSFRKDIDAEAILLGAED